MEELLGALRERTLEELDNEEGAAQDPMRRVMPSAAARRFTPPRFASEVTQGIRHGAAKLFKVRPGGAQSSQGSHAHLGNVTSTLLKKHNRIAK